MIRHRQVTKTVEEPESVQCDICGKEYGFDDDDLEANKFLHVDFTGGYESIFGDGVRVKCDICQHCLMKLIGEKCRKTDQYDVEE